MNASELARLMLKWEMLKREIETTELRIKEAVLELERTVDTGNVRASYSKGRVKYDYQAAAIANGCSLAPFERLIVDYRAACKGWAIPNQDIPFTQSEPNVTVKLLS